MYFCGYYVLSNCPNLEDFSIISTFGVIFGQNMDIWPPVVPIYRVPLNFYALNTGDLASRLNPIAFFVVIMC